MFITLDKIKDAVIAVTYRCNLRCRMCNIWQNDDFHNEIPSDEYLKLPENLEDINLTGGEPFLRSDLTQIVKNMVRCCPKAKIIISSNGFATDSILDSVKEIIKIAPNVGIAISIDGIGTEHDLIRGVDGCYSHAIFSIEGLKKIGLKNLKIAFTLGDYNINELCKVYRLSREMETEFSLSFVHSGKNYFNKENVFNDKEKAIAELEWLIKEELSTFNLKKWGRAYFAYGIREFLRTGKRILPDYSGKLNIFIDPHGKIYPNNVSDIEMGRIGESKITSETDEIARNWMMCTARLAIKKHWFRAGWRIMKEIFNQLAVL